MTCSRLTLLVLCTIFLRTCAKSDNSSKLEPKSAALYDPSDEVALRGYAGFEALYFSRNQVRATLSVCILFINCFENYMVSHIL